MDKIKLGITIGDINGIGPEIIIKALSQKAILNHCIPIIFGSSKVLSYYRNISNKTDFSFTICDDLKRLKPGNVYVLNCWRDSVNISVGKADENIGKLAGKAIEMGTQAAIDGEIDALITAPINKHTMNSAGWPAPGHTEYLANKSNTEDYLMLMVSDHLKIGVVTGHIPLSEVSKNITREKIAKTVKVMNNSLKRDFGFDKPLIAVLGMNPHAGDEGTIGKEDKEIISPLIHDLKKQGYLISGPYAADGFFGNATFKKFDGIISMYHDQGLVPFKALTFGEGVNFTAGLPFIRTSPDHGTAYSIAGQDLASPSSMVHAIFKAIEIVKTRREFDESNANPLARKRKKAEETPE